MKFTSQKPALPGFQITPMLDVVFLLLCFFVATSIYSQWESAMDIQLPTADTSVVPDRLPGEIIVNVDEAGAIRVNERVLTPDELLRRCRMLAKNFPGQSIVIRGDKRTAYDNVARVFDICRKADIRGIRLSTADAPAAP
jgi:biopolymer transport protein ExbD